MDQTAHRPRGGAVMDSGETAAGPTPHGYTVLAELGRGRLGRVLLCRDDGSGREVVVRVLDGSTRDERHRAVLQSELAAVAAASRHACAVPIESTWSDERAGMCLRQKYFPGGSAQALLDASSEWAVDDALVAGIRAAAALAHAHRHGVLHLDVRPQNLLADAEGNWSLADGGLARAVTGRGLATDPHAPRELLGWEEPGSAADVYGLGSTLGALLATPLGPHSPRQVELRPDLPPALVALLNRMTAADPSARPPLAEVDRVLRAQLDRASTGRTPAAETYGPTALVPLPVRQLGAVAPPMIDTGLRDRKKRVIAVAAAIAVAFVAAAGVTVATLEDDKPAQAAGEVSASGNAGAPEAEQGPPPVDDAAVPVTQPAPQGDTSADEALSAETTAAEPAKPKAAVPATKLVPAPITKNVAGHLVGDVLVSLRPAGYMISWSEPAIYKDVVGYLVVLTTPKNVVIARQFAAPGQTLVVLTSPPLAKNSCIRISTLVDTGDEVRIARQPKRDCKSIGAAYAGDRP